MPRRQHLVACSPDGLAVLQGKTPTVPRVLARQQATRRGSRWVGRPNPTKTGFVCFIAALGPLLSFFGCMLRLRTNVHALSVIIKGAILAGQSDDQMRTLAKEK